MSSGCVPRSRTEALRGIWDTFEGISSTPARSCYTPETLYLLRAGSVAGGRLGPPSLQLRRDTIGVILAQNLSYSGMLEARRLTYYRIMPVGNFGIAVIFSSASKPIYNNGYFFIKPLLNIGKACSIFDFYIKAVRACSVLYRKVVCPKLGISPATLRNLFFAFLHSVVIQHHFKARWPAIAAAKSFLKWFNL